MNQFFGWLATSAVTIMAFILTWLVIKYALKWATAGPWGVILLLVSTALTFFVAKLFFVPTVDDTYTALHAQLQESRFAADAATVLGAVPAQLGLSGQGASVLGPSGQAESPFEEGAPAGRTEAPAVVIESAPQATRMYFPPEPVTLAGDRLTLYAPDGVITVMEAKDVVSPQACGYDLTQVDPVTGLPLYLYTCPPEQGVRFPMSEVQLPGDFPQPPAGLVTAPQTETGGGGGFEIGDPQSGECLAAVLAQKGIGNSRTFGTAWLPAGSSWTVISPNWGSRAFTLDQNERWTLVSNDWDGIQFSITGELARQIGGAVGAGKTMATVIGTGPVPAACR